MKNNSKYQSEVEVIIRFLRGEMSETDSEKFRHWLNENYKNKILFEETKKVWEHCNNLSSIESIDVKKDWEKTKRRIDFKQDKTIYRFPATRKFQLWKAAAIVIVLLGIGILSKQFLFSPPEIILVKTGEVKKEIVLPDGTKAFLNNNSVLRFPEKFHKNKRLVSLSGEGYFEVTKDPDKRFRINIDEKAVVEVLGTSFNIRSAKEKGTVDVNVLSGKVVFYTRKNDKAKTILVKNENACLQDGIIQKNPTKDKNFLSWRTGIIYFEDEKIENVCKILSQFYKQEIIARGLENEEIRFTSTIDNQKLDSVLEEIRLVLHLDYTKNNKTVFIHHPE